MKHRWIAIAGLYLMSIILFAASYGCGKVHHEHGDLDDAKVMTVGDATIFIEERSQALETAVEGHREPSSSMVYMSWFPDSRTEMFVDIHGNGNGGKGILKDGKATYQLEPVVLTAAQVKEVEGLLSHLPPSVTNVPQGHAVLVSYHEGAEWQTHGYDRYALPAEVLRIYELSGAAITTAQATTAP